LALVLLVFSNRCSLETKPYKPAMTGKAGSVAIMIPDKMKEGFLEKMIRDSMEQYIPWLPQYEQQFDLKVYSFENPPRGAELSRNIIIFKTTNEIEPGIEVAKEPPFAAGQLYIIVHGRNEADFLNVFSQQYHVIKSLINKKEEARYKAEAEKVMDEALKKELKTLMGVSINLPAKNTKLKEKYRDFAWIKRDHKASKGGSTYWVQEGIMIYHRPYTDTTQFKTENLMKYRDEVLKKYVPGPAADRPTYMRTTPDSLYRPNATVLNLDGKYAVRIYGQWGITDSLGGFYGLGGPFVSISVHDARYQRIVTAEAYLNAPEFNHREYLRRLEGYLKSLQVGL
jgi:hypothetical protein